MSLYLLELYQGSPLRDAMMRSRWSLPPDDEAADMYLWAMERLETFGFCQYEISNVSRPGRESRHNLKYWEDGAWLGLGCGAHSTRGAERWKNVGSTTEYIRRVATGSDLAVETRTRPVAEQLGDALITGLRLANGLDLRAVGRRYGLDVWDRYKDALFPHLAAGRAVHEGDWLRLTREGMLVANEVMMTFV
jgi:oxygen-independent coproporphyrinogen-3 oxidase